MVAKPQIKPLGDSECETLQSQLSRGRRALRHLRLLAAGIEPDRRRILRLGGRLAGASTSRAALSRKLAMLLGLTPTLKFAIQALAAPTDVAQDQVWLRQFVTGSNEACWSAAPADSRSARPSRVAGDPKLNFICSPHS